MDTTIIGPGRIRDASSAGRRMRHQVMLAIFVSAVMPVLLMTYVVRTHVLPSLADHDDVIYLLAGSTLLAMGGGAWILADIARKVQQMSDMLAQRTAGIARTNGDLRDLTDAVNEGMVRIEDQAARLRLLGVRLAAVQEELERAKRRLGHTAREEHGRDTIVESRVAVHLVASVERRQILAA